MTRYLVIYNSVYKYLRSKPNKNPFGRTVTKQPPLKYQTLKTFIREANLRPLAPLVADTRLHIKGLVHDNAHV